MKERILKRSLAMLALTAWFFGPTLVWHMPRLYAASKKAGLTAPVNLNKANSQELQAVPGIGPAMAQRIVDYRAKFGKFERTEDLSNVPGIGPAKLEKMKSQITI